MQIFDVIVAVAVVVAKAPWFASGDINNLRYDVSPKLRLSNEEKQLYLTSLKNNTDTILTPSKWLDLKDTLLDIEIWGACNYVHLWK